MIWEFDKLKVLVWKNLLIRKRHWFVTILELILPLLLFTLTAYVFSHVPSIAKRYYNETTYSPVYNYKELSNEFPHDAVIYYTPNNTFYDNLMERVRNKLIITSERVLGFETKISLVKHYSNDSLNDYSINAIIVEFDDGIINEAKPKNLNYKIRSSNSNWNTNLLFPQLLSPGPMQNYEKYFSSGFTALQACLDTAYMEILSNSEIWKLPFDLSIQQFPYPPYVKDFYFNELYTVVLPVLTIIGFILLYPSAIMRIVDEKASGAKELMKLMGMKQWMLWFSWYLHIMFVYLLSVILISLILKWPSSDTKVIPSTNGFLLFIFLFFYLNAVIWSCFAFTTFFSKPIVAMCVGILVWILSYFIPTSFDIQYLPFLPKYILCLIPNVGLHLGYQGIASFEARHIGLTFSNLFDSPSGHARDFSLGFVFILMLIQTVFYMLLTFYIDNIKPGPYGLPKPFYYPLQIFKSNKCYKNDVCNGSILSTNENNKSIEPPTENMETSIQIKNLYKSFNNNVVAVNNLNVEIYKDQITVLLGHNGAGKTTTMNIITGMLSASKGDVFINDLNIKNNMDEIRKSLGLCTQHNLLFPELTVEEHLLFFSMMKGIGKNKAKKDINELLHQLNLFDKRNCMVVNLSGGMKRKLCLCIALVGKSNILILDEPTSGMDPEARRETWDVLQKLRKDRTIIITTHFMEEADALGDRIIIMDKGQLKCYGSTLFLKNLYGTGYQLSLLKIDDCVVKNVTEFIQKVTPNAKLKRLSGENLLYELPLDAIDKFPELFRQLENNLITLKINSLCISGTTLDEVFLRSGDIEEMCEIDFRSDPAYIEHSKLCKIPKSTKTNYKKLLKTLTKKRLLYIKRRWLAFLFQTLIPLILMIIVLYLMDTKNFDGLPAEDSLVLDIKAYKDSKVFYSADYVDAQQMAKYYTSEIPSAIRIPQDIGVSEALIEEGKKNIVHFRESFIIATEFNGTSDSSNLIANGLYSSIALHALPITMKHLSNSAVKYLMNSSEYSIIATNHPMEQKTIFAYETNQIQSSIQVMLLWCFLVPLGLVFLVNTVQHSVIIERVTGLKEQCLMTKLPVWFYWISHYIFDILIYLVDVLIIIICIAAFSKVLRGADELFTISLILMVYGLSSIPFAYLLSYRSQTIMGGLMKLLIVGFVSSVLVIVIYVIDQSKIIEYQNSWGWLKYVCYLIPHANLSYELLKFSHEAVESDRCRSMAKNIRDILCGNNFNTDSCCSFDMENNNISLYFNSEQHSIFTDMMWMMGSSLLYLCIVIFIDTVYFYKIRNYIHSKHVNLHKNVLNHKVLDLIHKDCSCTDIKTEELNDVSTGISIQKHDPSRDITDYPKDSLFKAHNLKKIYTSTLRQHTAVNDVSFEISEGECFGLLGVNGAGKTTTFKMLTGSIYPTEGETLIRNSSLKRNRHQYLENIGYCPQFDAVSDCLTGKELLTIFIKMHGIEDDNDADKEVDYWIQLLGLEIYKDKTIGTYSGGTKRKLSIALSLIGKPEIVLLDEPTNGVDPAARRSIWNVLNQLKNGNQSIILTSHSMDECEALCDRIAIMVKGSIKCIGSTLQIKEEYGQGFIVMLKLHWSNENKNRLDDFKKEIEDFFKNFVIMDEHKCQIVYNVKKKDLTLSLLFTQLNILKGKYKDILELYTASNSTLEQVFLYIAKNPNCKAFSFLEENKL